MELLGANPAKIQEIVDIDKSISKSREKSRIQIEIQNKSHGKIPETELQPFVNKH